jgi:hypothetical protein
MIGLVTLDFWHTLFADTADNLRRAHALRPTGVRTTLAEAGHRYRAGQLAAADAWAGEAFAAMWREHRDMFAAEQVRRFVPRAEGPEEADAVLRSFADLPALVARLG